MKRECKLEDNKAQCTCTYLACNRRGICCECITHHRNQGQLPGCLFPPEWERKYDRSIEAFLKAHRK